MSETSEPRGEVWSDRALPGAAAFLAAYASAAIVSFAVLRPNIITFSARPTHLLIAGLGVVFLFLVVRHSAIALPLLSVFIYLNLSEVLVRFHDFPSVLQLVALPLFFAAWLGGGAVETGSILRKRLTLLLVLYVTVVIASTTWATDLHVAEERMWDTIKSAVLFFLVALLATTLRRFEQAIYALVASAAFLSILPIIQILGPGFDNEFGGFARVKLAHIYGDVFQERIAGPLGDPNFFAQILLVALPLAVFIARRTLSLRLRIFGGFSSLVIVAAILLSYSRGAMLSMMVMAAMTLLVFRVGWRNAALGAAVVLIGLILLPRSFTQRFITIEKIFPTGEASLHPDASFEKRRLLTGSALAMFLDHPLIGVGTANFTTHFETYAEQVGSVSREYEGADERHYPHNLYLEIGAETGFLGLTVFAAVIAAFFVYTRRSRRILTAAGLSHAAGLASALEIGMVGYLVAALFLHGEFQRYLWLLFALGVTIDRLAQSRDEAPSFRSKREGVEGVRNPAGGNLPVGETP